MPAANTYVPMVAEMLHCKLGVFVTDDTVTNTARRQAVRRAQDPAVDPPGQAHGKTVGECRVGVEP